MLGACSSGNLNVKPHAITLPAIPTNLKSCFNERMIQIPQGRDLTGRDVRIIIDADTVLDMKKTECGRQALSWMESIRIKYGSAGATN